MRYLGGKSRTWKEICAFLEHIRKPNQTYLEPFVGGAYVLQGMSGNRYASDANKALITMYKSLQNGWIPPNVVSEELYNEIKQNQNFDDPMTAFVGFGCSFGGKWFGGYARNDKKRNYASNSANSLIQLAPKIKHIRFEHRCYSQHSPDKKLIYCDPPYEDTTKYDAVNEFEHEMFWQTMRLWSQNNTVVISEYKAPDDFVCVKEINVETDMNCKEGKEARIERLFMLEGTEKFGPEGFAEFFN